MLSLWYLDFCANICEEFDPEENVDDQSSEGSDEDSEDENRGTEHYVNVGYVIYS